MARMTAGFTLGETAQRLGELIGAKQLEFERLGGWAGAVHDPALTVALARVGVHQGWGAQLLERLLPVTRDHDPALVIATARRGTEPPGEPPSDGAVILDEVRGILLRLVDAAEHLGREMSPVSDRAVRRLLRIVADSDRRDLEALSGGRRRSE